MKILTISVQNDLYADIKIIMAKMGLKNRSEAVSILLRAAIKLEKDKIGANYE